MDIGALFNSIFFAPIINFLILLFKLFSSAGIPGALGFAIIILTLALRFLIWPLSASQLKSAQKMQELKPLLDALKQKHKDDKKAFAEAQMILFKQHGVNPAGGCLPALLQLPIFIALYQAIINVFPVTGGGDLARINSVLYHPWLHLSSPPDPSFFGLNLATTPSQFGSQGVFLLMVPLATAAFTFVQSKMMVPSKIKHYPAETTKETKEKETMEEMMGGVQQQMIYLMPLMIGYFAFQFPVGLAIYWNTFTIMGIIQQYRISGWGGMADLWKKILVKF